MEEEREEKKGLYTVLDQCVYIYYTSTVEQYLRVLAAQW